MPEIRYQKTTEEMQLECQALFRLMGRQILHGNYNDAQWIFWSNIARMINQSEMPMSAKSDCFGIIRRYLTGGDFGEMDYWIEFRERENSKIYVLCNKRYRFSERLSELGDFWKEEIRDRHSFGIRGIVNWLVLFQKEILPFVDTAIESCELEWKDDFDLSERDIDLRKRKFRSYQAMLNNCQLKMQGAREAIDLLIEE